jgi:hypothetical protein
LQGLRGAVAETERSEENVGRERDYPAESKEIFEDRAASESDGASTKGVPSFLTLERAEALSTSIVPIMAPNTLPQPPKRNKHKYKHRNHYLGRLYFSDENIFVPDEIESQSNENIDRKKPIECETISVTITTPQISYCEVGDQQETESSSSSMNFVNAADKINTLPLNKEEAAKTKESDNVEAFPANVVHGQEVDNDAQQNPTAPSSPEDSLKPYWPLPATATSERKLTPQTSTEREDEPECVNTHRKYHLFTRGDSFSEAESDQGDKRSISPAGFNNGRLSPSPYAYELSDSDSRKGRHSPVPYSKRPLRGPYLEMIVNEQKKPEKAKNTFRNLQMFDSQFPPSQTLVHDRAVDDYYLRRSNTSPHSVKLKEIASPKRKISANIPFFSPSLSRDTLDEKTLLHHQRTTSSPSQLEFFPTNQLPTEQCAAVPSQQLLQQLLRGSSERSLMQDIYPKPTYKVSVIHEIQFHFFFSEKKP